LHVLSWRPKFWEEFLLNQKGEVEGRGSGEIVFVDYAQIKQRLSFVHIDSSVFSIPLLKFRL
jgi:hypothetical protein